MFLITRCKNGDRRLYHLKAKQMIYKVCFAESEWMRKEQNSTRAKGSPGITHDAQNEMEKWVLVCRLKENNFTTDKSSKVLRDERRKSHTSSRGFVVPKRSHFQNIGNSLLMRQTSKAILPLHPPVFQYREHFDRVILGNCHSARCLSSCLAISSVTLHIIIIFLAPDNSKGFY